MQGVRIEAFSVEQMIATADSRNHFDVALVFSTKYEPPHAFFDRLEKWRELKQRFFGYERDVPPVVSAEMLGGDIVYSARRQGQWVAIIELKREEIMNAERITPFRGRRLR
jgi:hypothetical protein